MTTSRDPKPPRNRAKSKASEASGKGYRTPVSRRLKYWLQDAGYALKKAARRVTDPLRDAGSRSSGGRSNTPKPSPERRERKRPRARARGRERSASGARELGERPTTPAGRRERPRGERPARSKPSGAGIAAAITRFGERASKLILGVLAPLAGPLAAVAALAGRALRALEAAITPLRATIAVTALAAILLGVSQFTDYRGVAVGVADYSAYADVEVVAPAPQVDRQPAGSAHAYMLIPVAILALAGLFACLRGRWQFGRLVALLGVIAIAVIVIVDVPAGLDEGEQAIAYAGVEAQLVEGFYAQLVSAAVMVAGGLLVAHYARLEGDRSPRTRRRRSRAVATPRARAA